jgi:ParB family chromosome partitioning protein
MFSELVMLELEIEENVQRMNLTGQELTEATARLKKMRNPGRLRRIWNTIIGFFRKLIRR